MLSSDQPDQVQIPFADTGTKRPIPIPSQIGITDGAASYTDGFPPKTFLPLAVGGIPPAGADFNGILNAITLIQQWQSAGGLFKYDAAFSASVGGYPKGARISNAADTDIWVSTVDNNVTDPDGGSPVGWLSISDTLVFLQAGVGAVAQTLPEKAKQDTNFFDYMDAATKAAVIAGAGLTDVYAECQAAIDAVSGPVYMNPGVYLLSAQLIVRNNCTGIIGNNGYYCVFKKGFNGDAISSLISGAILTGFGINGQGATYTGGGILPEGYNTVMEKLRIDDTADACIKFNAAIGTNAGSGTYSSVRDCFLRPTNAVTTYAVRSIGTDDSIRPTCRTFDKLSGGSSLVDFSGMNFCSLTDSLGTLVKFSANSGKVHMTGNRLSSSADITVLGVDHIIDENSIGFSVGFNFIIDSTTANVHYGPGNAISINGIIGKSPVLNAAVGLANPNYVHTELTSYAFGWFGAGGNPTLGNATTSAYYKLSGSKCYVTMSLVVGSTTVAGTGQYSFQLPFKAFVTSTGTALVKSSTGSYFEGTFIVQGGSAVGIMYLSDAATAAFASTTMTFSTGGTLNVTIDYLVAPT